MAEIELYRFIDALSVSKEWKKKFKLIHLIYHRNYHDGNFKPTTSWISLPEVSTLGLFEKWKFFCNFNFIALIFGPIYYLVKQMYAKAVVLSIITYILYSISNTTACLIPLVFLHCAIYADVDYFVNKVLMNERVKNDVVILEDSFDMTHFNFLLESKNPAPLKVPFIILLCIMLCVYVTFSSIDAFKNSRAMVKIPVYCTNNAECAAPLGENLLKLKTATRSNQYLYAYKTACIYTVMKDKQSAIKYLDLSIQKNPKFPPAYLLRASLYIDLGSPQSAIVDYKKALRADSKLIGANYNIGRCYYKLKDYKKALSYFKLATKRYPYNAGYFEIQGYTRVCLNDIIGAKKDLQRAVILYSLNILETDKSRLNVVKRYLETL